jgi:serine O-acetyltransferase
LKEPYKYLINLRQQIREDWIVNGRDWTQPGFRAVAVHRFGVWLKTVRPHLVRMILHRCYLIMFRYVRNHYGIELYDSTIVGRRVIIAHQGGIVIHPRAEIGDDCIIRQNVTIGAAIHERWQEAPTLGHGVQVGSGAAIIGKIRIGDHARIGPNAVVMTNVPAGATVFTNPPRMIKTPQAQKRAG